MSLLINQSNHRMIVANSSGNISVIRNYIIPVEFTGS